MSQDQNAILQLRLDQNYQDYLAQLQEKPFEEIIRLAPEITAAQQLCDELAAVCDDDEVEYLLGLDNPLEVVRGYWEQEISGYDHGEEMGHMLWEIRERELYSKELLAQPVSPAVQSKNPKKKERHSHER